MSHARILAALLLASFIGVPVAAAKDAPGSSTDAYSVQAPAKPWLRAPGLEPAGQLSWSIGKQGESQALLRVEYVGVLSSDRASAYATLLRIARAGVRETVDDRTDVERSDFEPDSMIIANWLAWRGFRVDLRTSAMRGSSWRWFALHPDFPRRRVAFSVVYEQTASLRTPPIERVADARAVARSLNVRGRGLAGDLPDAWLDARALAFASLIDSAQKLCWTTRAEGSRGESHLGYAAGAAGDGDFFQVTGPPRADSLADAAPSEYGVSFDRNGDGRPDLVVINRGVRPFESNAQQPTVAILADDDFDGLTDGAVLEDVDVDGNGRVEARLRVQERGTSRVFTDAIREGGKDQGKSAGTAEGKITVGRVGVAPGPVDYAEIFRAAGPHLSELAAARAHCVPR